MKKEIEIYGEGYYANSSGYIHGKDGRILKGMKGSKRDYLSVSLSHKGVVKHFLVHRLIAITFLENPENKPEVNHKNGDVQDNSLENLEWVTSRENKLHSYHILGNTKGCVPMRGKFGKDHNKSKAIKLSTPEGDTLVFGSLEEMNRELGYTMSAISWAKDNKTLPYTFKKGTNKGVTILEYPHIQLKG